MEIQENTYLDDELASAIKSFVTKKDMVEVFNETGYKVRTMQEIIGQNLMVKKASMKAVFALLEKCEARAKEAHQILNEALNSKK